MAGSYDLKRSGDHLMFNLKARNGEVILSSQRYTTKKAAEEGIASGKTNSARDARYEKADAKNGERFFRLLAADTQVIGTSVMYSSASSRDKGIPSVKANGPTAAVKDDT